MSDDRLPDLFLELIGAFSTLPGDANPEVRSYIIRALSIDELLALANQLAAAAAHGDVERVLDSWQALKGDGT
jgi:hypothetical protein